MFRSLLSGQQSFNCEQLDAGDLFFAARPAFVNSSRRCFRAHFGRRFIERNQHADFSFLALTNGIERADVIRFQHAAFDADDDFLRLALQIVKKFYLNRIISASSNKGDVVLDPFCGCGTAVHAAQKLKRNWIGIDITCLAIALIEKRLKDAFGARCKFEIHGTPKDLESASDLAGGFEDAMHF